MKKITVSLAAAAALAAGFAGCSKDDGSHANQPGVSPISEAELGPQRARKVTANEVTITSKSPEAVELFKQGRDAVENVRNQVAREKLTRALELDPKFALAHAYLAVVEHKSKAKEAHSERLSTAMELAENASLAEKLIIKALKLDAEGNSEGAAEVHDKLAAQAPGDWRARYWVALDKQRAGEIDAAIADLELSATLNPQAAAPLNHLAYLYADKKQFDKALATVDRYVAAKPGEPNPLDSKAEILMRAGKLADAERFFAKAAKTSPDFYIANTGLAAARFHQGNWDGGIEALNAYVAASARPWEARTGRSEIAWAKLAKDDLEGALAMAKTMGMTAVELGEKDGIAHAHYLMSELYLEAGEYQQALAIADKIVKDADTPAWMRAWVHFVQFRAAVGLGKMDKATKYLAEINAAAAKDEKDEHGMGGAAAYAEAMMAWKKGDIAAAAAALDKVEAEGAVGYRARWLRAKALAKLGKKKEAAKLRETLASTYSRRASEAYLRAHFMDNGQI